ncbi:hypothetical protein E4O03_07835 [Treponema sp. OMZ 792]|uniref:hypothetical protein n=1 Tax=unclassified Treponema TaxID=2638727 RepID=UPI0020A2BE3C|nr:MULTISPECIES: hypothetical protein [unclassified Treponema]UTC74157.1 hypothetical protein E4O03_07835 [Treponema sp. OMZ 792]UTC80554.1 hypothetical protein E4O07_07740 [Treponema sp. OMZ 798]
MNEKKFFIFIVCILLLFTGCRTANGIYDNRVGAYKARDSIGEVGERQTDAIIANTELGNRIKRGSEISRELNRSVDTSEAIFEEIREILRRIRKRKQGFDSTEGRKNPEKTNGD